MQNILAKIGAFFEAHVEKIVLALAGTVGLWLLMVFVVMSPNAVSYENLSFSPGSLDAYIYTKKAKIVRDQLSQPANASESASQSILTGPIDVEDFGRPLPKGFEGLFACSMSNIDSRIVTSVPANRSGRKSDGREYALPFVGEVSQVQVNHIRAAAYKPGQVVTDTQTYQSVPHDVNDVDLVTVQARFDVASLRARFLESFAGGSLPAAWRDETMAKPVFAAVDLQRQAMNSDGSWGPWEDVPRIATLPQNETYAVIEKANDLPAGGARVRMIRLNEETVRTNILQPPAYEIASTYEEWLPPEFHGKFLVERAKEEAAKRREEREAEKNSQQDSGNSRGRQRGGTNTQQGTGRSIGVGGMGNDTGRRGTRRGTNAQGNDRNALQGPGGATNDRNTRRGRSNTRGAQDLYGNMDGGRLGGLGNQMSPLDEVFEAFEKIRLSPTNDFSRLDNIVFWAHDDSVEPGKTYQYRIRLGVLNPVAGLDSVVQKDIAFKDQVILWSEFSDVTQPVDIPNRLYFFANNYQEVSNSVAVEVSKFTRGYWRSSIFSVKPGETIGRLVEIEPEKTDEQNMIGGRQMNLGMFPPQPEMVDFSTDVIFVAAERANKWIGGKNLRAQVSFDMLYSQNGLDIQRLSIGSKNWPENLQAAYGSIKKLEKEPIEEYRSFGSSRTASNALGLGGRDQMGMGRNPYGR